MTNKCVEDKKKNQQKGKQDNGKQALRQKVQSMNQDKRGLKLN